MKIEHAQRYRLDTRTDGYTVIGPGDVRHFTSRAAQHGPKLYIISRRGVPGYVGVTTQSMAARICFGLRATGQHGYHGYQWRNQSGLDFDIWCLLGASSDSAAVELECVEAEVVFLARQKFKQWPKFQTEIHFHPSKQFHRDAAHRILQHLIANA